SRRLLRRHLLDLAGGGMEAHALDFVGVGPGHAAEAGVVGMVVRMDGAVLIDAGGSRQQAILFARLGVALSRIGAAVPRPPAPTRPCRCSAWPGRRSPRTRRGRAAATPEPCR